VSLRASDTGARLDRAVGVKGWTRDRYLTTTEHAKTSSTSSGMRLALRSATMTGASAQPTMENEHRVSVEHRLRMLIRERLANFDPHSLPVLARALAMSARTLQRKLQAEGTSFGQALHEERERAWHMLMHSGCTRDEVARAIGYESTRSLDRIHRRARTAAAQAE
jgi:transcriptional regulator GlxA family with amidase domain